MKNAGKFLAVLALVIIGLGRAEAQVTNRGDEANKQAEVSNLVNSGRYTFVASKVNNHTGTLPLPNGYVLDVSKDTLVARLPGYKRVNITDAIDSTLTCTSFTYTMTPQSNGGWLVTMHPASPGAGDFGPLGELKLDIAITGYTTLTLSGNKAISYYGYIRQHSAEFIAATSY